MKADCHIHFLLDGAHWKNAIDRHRNKPDENWVRQCLQTYKRQGYSYLRDGGDRWGVGVLARQLAPEYGIICRTPGAPLYKNGCYGSFIGTGWENLKEYQTLVENARREKLDFIKIMISGLMDFNSFGVLTQPGLPRETIRELIHIAHSEGFSVMVHANGGDTVAFAAEAGVDSVEHGAYLNTEALYAMKEAGTVWVPTLSTVGNLLGKGRFEEGSVRRILDSALENIRAFREIGGLLAPGTDAGAWAVPHGSETEKSLLAQAGVEENYLQTGIKVIMEKF